MTGPRGSLTPDVGGLGAKVERPARAPANVPLEHNQTIERTPDGRLRTNDPRNERANNPFYIPGVSR